MNSVTQPVVKETRHTGGNRSAKEWLDAVVSGQCDHDNFYRGVKELLDKTPDSGWELFGLVDQYFRRGKLSAQNFSAFKTYLQGLLVGGDRSDEVGKPPRMQDEPPAGAVTVTRAAQAEAFRQRYANARAIPPRRLDVARAEPPAAETRAAETRAADRAIVPPAAPEVAATTAVPGHAAGLITGPARTAARSVAPDEAVASDADLGDADLGADFESAGLGEGTVTRELQPGDVLRNRYLVQGLLGQGGMGTVYAAIDQFRLDRSSSDQRVALKVLHTEVIKRPRLFAELRREFQHLQSLSHPNVVRVHEFDRDGDLAFFTMEFLSGTLLSRVLAAHESTRLHRPYALSIVRDVGAAVAHAHGRGVVHGDLNPGNIFITDAGEVRVLDFGASHPLRRGPWISEFDAQDQIAVATPAYASCQVLEGETADARDDVYALACVAYVLLSGAHPFGDRTALEARTQRRGPKRPAGLRRSQWVALQNGLEFDRERRPSDMKSWLERLDLAGAVPHLPELMSLRTVRPAVRRRSWLPALAAALLVAAGLGWAALNPEGMRRAADAVVESGTSALAALRASSLWDKAMSLSQHTEPVIRVTPAPDTLAESAPARDQSAVPESPPPESPPPEARPVPPPARSHDAPAASVARAAPSARAAADPGRALPARPATELRGLDASPVPPPAASGSHQPVATAGDVAAAPAVAAAPQPVAPADAAHGDAGRSRIELAADSIEVPAGEPMAHIVVRRRGSLHGDATFSWWTESGTAKPGRDFVPVKTQVEHIDNGQNALNLIIPVIKDPSRRDARSFYVVIDQPSDNATLGARTLTMVTIPGPTQDGQSPGE